MSLPNMMVPGRIFNRKGGLGVETEYCFKLLCTRLGCKLAKIGWGVLSVVESIMVRIVELRSEESVPRLVEISPFSHCGGIQEIACSCYRKASATSLTRVDVIHFQLSPPTFR